MNPAGVSKFGFLSPFATHPAVAAGAKPVDPGDFGGAARGPMTRLTATRPEPLTVKPLTVKPLTVKP
jgi:hypothetical protein